MLIQNIFNMLKLGVFEDFITHGHPWGWADTLVLTFAGFLIVFIVLMLLIITFSIFGKIMQKVNAKNTQAKVEEKPVQSAANGEVDDETAAVITAAIAQASGGKKFIIKDIKEAKE